MVDVSCKRPSLSPFPHCNFCVSSFDGGFSPSIDFGGVCLCHSVHPEIGWLFYMVGFFVIDSFLA